MSTQNPVFIPGPTNIPERLRHAMNVPTMDHRAPDFVQILAPLLVDLKKIFKTETGTVITFPASGTGGWEAALTNTLSPGDRVLIARFGMFSHRWIEMCQHLGLDVDVIDCAWGEGAPADEYGKRLAADTDHKIKAVLVTHNETATGVASDVAAVRKAMDTAQHPALLYVDAVSSLGSIDFRMDEWGVDLAISGSQKGFMLATGMAHPGPSAVRYPRGSGPGADIDEKLRPLPIGEARILRSALGRRRPRVAILAFGIMVEPALAAAELLDATVVDMRFVKPLDEDMILRMADEADLLVTVEDNVIAGGAGSAVNEVLMERHLAVPALNLGLPDAFVEHGGREEMLASLGLDAAGIQRAIQRRLRARDLDEASSAGQAG